MADAIVTEGLTKAYGAKVALAPLDLRVAEGSVYGFLGPNGAGKTTTIRLLLGFMRADRGRAEIFGVDCWRAGPQAKYEVGYVPGDLRLHSWMNSVDALAVFGRARGRDMREPGLGLAERWELDPRVRVRNMSRGMRQKLGLILALAAEPRLLVLDEPTTGLDPITQDRLTTELLQRAARGATVFFSSHVLSEVEDLCERVAILRQGHLVAEEGLEALRRRAGRAVMILWAGQPPDACPPFLAELDARGAEWRASLRGPVGALLEWLRGRDVADLEIGRPDLDRVFRSYYREDGAP
ncbi:MAG: ABC transporter ATP-binding protein [Planctomycetota bacterium]